MNIYLPILYKLAIGLIALIIQINIMGKGNLAPSNALDQVQNYVLGGIIGGTIYSDTITVFQFMVVLIMWTLLVMILKFLKEHSRLAKAVIDGQPVIVIENGRIDAGKVILAGLSASDLMFKLREQNIYDVSKVKRAVLEQNGQLTLIEYGDQSPKYPIIYDGQANMEVLDAIDQDADWLLVQVQKQGYTNIRSIFVGEYIEGQIRLTPYDQTDLNTKIKLKK
ncbi:DUF421 domain-containing protein [Convivina intestini]|uniref:Uncharacterized membrane protein YcaP (DUF421 family) n=1 Tax=Convivina intestini TaxID=1505726 RepID=A0A2U1DBG8_9LACO|nr:DUF421 domain-containing protein [Convivina intestini]PVY85044.1 uncharacterized membrane protein YcaP (DUF421 family) [Convivina intestini]CAH1853497.1 hypothetical protein R077811_00717 [Convivina intestini]CAH1855646.1 hypothetical protein R078131_01239 [Convivina intestini]SDB89122.1 Uncharacterized membrane protein YcaP, DUF421 family [Leuconostocaceae bacterium R-53105]